MKFERFMEARFGFRAPWVHIVTLYVLLREFRVIRQALSGTNYRRRLIVSFGPAAYLESIREVIQQLISGGWQIILCPEWETARYPNWNTLNQSHPGAIFLPNSSRALPLIRSEVFLSSVAGKHRYFPRLARRVFYFHSLAGLEGFPEGGLDSYEFFLCATAQQKRQITDRRRALGLGTEGVLNGGYPRYDVIAERIASETSPSKTFRTLVYAPTYSGLFPADVLKRTEAGKLIISEAITSGYYVVFRPHPLTLEQRKDPLTEWFMTQLDRGLVAGKIDVSVDYFKTYQESDVMVTDMSGSSVVFGAVFRKPVIFHGTSKEHLDSMIEGWTSVGRWAGDRHLLRELLREPSWEADSEFKILQAGIGVSTYVNEIERISKTKGLSSMPGINALD
jgi:CDP-glycerol glycerophosphotransferase (TagB/SpsB family)